jgi:hypothetical protein
VVGRSHVVALTLVGIVGTLMAARLSAPGGQMRSNVYNWREDCERDYSPSQCQASGNYTGAGYSPGGWHGPYYYSNRSAAEAHGDPGPGRFGLAASVSSRGGFGSFARVFRVST